MRLTLRLPLLFLASTTSLLSITATARAADPAAAQTLFDQAKQLLEHGRVAEACTRFEESQKLDPGIGTLFQYASCEERLGKSATAWAAFLEVAAEAKASGETAREKVARDRAAVLQSTLARIVIEPGADRGIAGLEIRRDGAPLVEGEWSTAVPIDPGDHTIEARAPQHGTWSSIVHVAPGSSQVVSVPLLAPAPVAAPAPPPATASSTTTTSAEVESPSRGGTQRGIGLALGAAGLVGAGVGAYFGVVAVGKHSDSNAHCVGNVCDAQGVGLRDDSVHAGNASTVAFIAGGGLLVAGLVTFFTAPHDAPLPVTTARADTTPRFSVSPTGVGLSGAF